MKKILLLSSMFIMMCSTSFAATPDQVIEPNSIAGIKDVGNYTATPPAPPESGSIVGKRGDYVPLGRGCCSHHDGVCGCENGRQVCCDGSYSPSCRC